MPVETDYAGSVSRFIAAHGLTPREGRIVELILAGCPTEDISRKLHISRGTVKNHRGRLYYKLDITTERELFSLFLPHLLKTWAPQNPRQSEHKTQFGDACRLLPEPLIQRVEDRKSVATR